MEKCLNGEENIEVTNLFDKQLPQHLQRNYPIRYYEYLLVDIGIGFDATCKMFDRKKGHYFLLSFFILFYQVFAVIALSEFRKQT